MQQIERVRRNIRMMKTTFSKKKCELKSCEEPVGIVSQGQEKRFHSKECRKKRHNNTR